MNDKIHIGEIFVESIEDELFAHGVRLCSNISMEKNGEKIEKKCYFEFDKKYEKYLCYERSDAFVMGLLSSAMELGQDIEFETPISAKLYYQLTSYYIPVVAKYNSSYPMHNIKLIGPLDNTVIKNEKAVATGCSGGVDSFYTITKHLKDEGVPKDFRLTHIVYNSSCSSDIIESRLRDNFINTYKKMDNIARLYHIDLIACYSNLYEFYIFPFKAFNMFFTTIYGFVPYALQKLISVYYASSGAPISEFNLDVSKAGGHDSSVFDVFTVLNMNTENLSFYSAGTECNRIDKEIFIADDKVANDNLIVCASQVFIDNYNYKYNNCSMCPKCLRTMTHFYVINKLDNFKNSFNVEKFYKNRKKYIGKMIATDKRSYVNDVKNCAKKYKVKIPFISYIYAYLWYKPIHFLRKTFSNSMLARKIYYKLNLDYKLDGYRHVKYKAYEDKIKKK